MGREIRRVPPDWEHPKGEVRWSREPQYLPLHDWSFQEKVAEWKAGLAEWENGERQRIKATYGDDVEYWEWEGRPPDRDYCRPDWPEETRTAYQVYETVSEGTPKSPVFATADALEDWLVENGMSRLAARQFIADGWQPSGMFTPHTGLVWGMNDLAEMQVKP